MALTPAMSSSKRKITTSAKSWTGSIPQDKLPLFHDFVAETVNRLRGPFLAQHAPTQVIRALEEAFLFTLKRPAREITTDIRPRAKGVAVFNAMLDQPFIVDTMRLFLRKHRADYWGGFNLLFTAKRDEDGNLLSIGGSDGVLESVVMLEADSGRLGDLDAAAAVLQLQLTLARATVLDFKPMTRRIERFIERTETEADRNPGESSDLNETADFLRWLLRENFVFMGIQGGGDPLGIETIDSLWQGNDGGDWNYAHADGRIKVRKSSLESPIHRNGRIDEVLVTVAGESLLIRGMFTYRAVTQPSRNVPVLRRILAGILQHETESPGSYRYKGMANVFDSLPTEFLFTATPDAISHMVDLVFESEQQQDVGVTFIMTGSDSAFCLLAMPKSQFSDELRRDLEAEIVGSLKATYTDHGLFVGRYETVLLHYYLTGVKVKGDATVQKLTERIRKLATPWLARLWHALADKYDEEAADRLADTYGRAFPETYTRNTPAERAVRDVEMLGRLSQGKSVLADLFEEEDNLILRLYQAEDVFLTDILPVLDNLGLTVIDSYATSIRSRGGELAMDTFRLEADENQRAMLLERKELLRDTLAAVFDGDVENDALNALVLTSGLSWREVDVVRAFGRYGRQLNLSMGMARIQEIFINNPMMCHSLVDLFHARFDPEVEGDREHLVGRADETVVDELRYIMSHDEDLVFSTLHTLINAAVRTNYYRPDRPFWYLSFKFRCADLEAIMGRGRPMWEIYVHHREVEGVHLRFGMVARGGLRWSDREDFRTEVLGLATTQQVKNVVIVPTGSKGGFFLRNRSADRAKAREEADYHYQTFIRGLLDVTDNTQGGEIVPPPGVVRHDGDDPYLVVAADKGTAHLSDTANGVSESFGFWLADAFASGGSNGYDHKKVGITARGAWVLVRRHFAEMGKDPYSEPFTVAGIGDLGGDVFGNGLVESPHAKLVAAFNHLHIFLDPTPDTAKSFEERKRLFAAGPRGGGWDSYDTSLISEGGGVFDRRAKSMKLSPQARALLGIEADEVAPELVIKHILKLDVDLLWNGGIGTYVKASHETHADADDRANNGVRIDATELRAKIIGEGGNLGMTQQARIEADRCGVRLNTDAIDNSAGVDMSDHEVNLKILVGAVESDGKLTRDERNTLLESMTEEVAELVLANNDAHGRQLSRDQLRAKQDMFQFGRAISFIERAFGKQRADLNLPTDRELRTRFDAGESLSRAELAVLSAWVKMYVKKELIAGDVKSLPGYRTLLHTYFPKKVQELYPEYIDNHMLADEIVVTQICTKLVADAGAAFFPMTIATTGASVAEIAKAMLNAQVLAKSGEIRGCLEELRTSVSLRDLYGAWVRVDAGIREVVLYWLSAKGRIPNEQELLEMAAAAHAVYELQSSEVAKANQNLLKRMLDADIPDDVAELVLRAKYLNVALMIWAESNRTSDDFGPTAIKHLAVARASRLQEVLDDLQTRPAGGRWDPIALRILYSRFHRLLRLLVGSTPNEGITTVDELAPKLAEGYLADVRAQVDRFLTDDDDAPAVATLLVMEERVESALMRLPNSLL